GQFGEGSGSDARAAMKPSPNGPRGTEIQTQLFAALAFELGGKCSYHRLNGARAQRATASSSLIAQDRGRTKRFRLGADAFNRRAATGELILKPFEAAVEMINTIDHGLTLGG